MMLQRGSTVSYITMNYSGASIKGHSCIYKRSSVMCNCVLICIQAKEQIEAYEIIILFTFCVSEHIQ